VRQVGYLQESEVVIKFRVASDLGPGKIEIFKM
jgi:hypothetical protein